MLCGLVGGVAVGAIQGVAGVVVGVVAGVGVGWIAGRVLAHEEGRRSARNRELDQIIGVTHGSLGVGPVRRSPEPDPELQAEPWGPDVLTPPPPQAT
jgi:hypothetical protein